MAENRIGWRPLGKTLDGKLHLRGGGLVALALPLLALPAASQAATNRDLLRDANLRIDGQAASDQGGSSVSDAGDVNGDGRDDVIVGARLAGEPRSGGAFGQPGLSD